MPNPTPAERADLEAELGRLKTALEEMETGSRLSSVDAPGGRSMSFAQGDSVAVRARIARIERLLGRGGRAAVIPYFGG